MGATRLKDLQFYPGGSYERARVDAQHNNYTALYQGIPPRFKPNWGASPSGCIQNGPGYWSYTNTRPPIHNVLGRGSFFREEKQVPVRQKPSGSAYSYYVSPHSSADRIQAPPKLNSDTGEYNENVHKHYQQFQNGNVNHIHTHHSALLNGGHQQLPYQAMPSPQTYPYPMMYDQQHTYAMPPSRGLQIAPAGGSHFADNRDGYAAEPNGFYYEPNSHYRLAAPQTSYSPIIYRNGHSTYDPGAQYGFAAASTDYSSIQQSTQPSGLTESATEIQQIAWAFANTFCPMLGEKPYCFPPIKRHMHPDKQLVLAMESEKRVLGSFEQFFAEKQIPAFMLCQYPVSGFMQNFQGKTDYLDRDTPTNGGKDTITLLLLSDLFSVTVVTVSIISGNSDLAYIQRGLHKAGMYNKRCIDAVTDWLNFLGVRSEVRQVIAFPNLKRATLNRIKKEKQLKQNFGLLCTIHADELPTPFEQDWSSDARKLLFAEWIERKVLRHPPTLSTGQLHLVVGALLSPRLSKVDFVLNEKAISPIAESINSAVLSEQVKEDVSQLKLTVDGLTKSFDKFMDEYVSCYYPNLDKQTYRVPPIHFNIQSFKKSSDYLETLRADQSKQATSALLDQKPKNCEACPVADCSNFNQENSNSEFMPPSRPFVMTATRSSCCSNDTDNQFPQMPDSSPNTLNVSPGDACFEALEDVEVLMEVMTKDVRADEGENRVITVLEMLGRRYGPMFIICGYQYNNYLNKLREEMFSKDNAVRPIRAFGQTMRAEHDCLIFHKRYGAIIVCIKAVGDNFEDWSASEEQKIMCTKRILEKAVKQLDREEAMIKHVTSDLHAKLACHKLIALPNMTRESVEKALMADDNLVKKIRNSLGHGVEGFLCSDELPPRHQAGWDYEDKNLWEKLKSWWKNSENLFNKVPGVGITSEIYRQLVGRYCGLFSTVEVWSPANPRAEVRSASQASSLCADRFRKLILLPHQVKALCSNDKRMFIYGPPGSGKTLLLLLKAKEWLLSGESVILINSRSGSEHGYPYAFGVHQRLRQMIKEARINFNKLSMININSLNFKATELARVMPSSCIIMDELNPAAHDIVEHLSCLQVKNIWCAGLFEEYIPVTAHSFSSHKMDVILRCPPIVQSLLKQTEPDVRPLQPYKNSYQSSVLDKGKQGMQKNNPFSGNSGRSIFDSEAVKSSQDTNKESTKTGVADTSSQLEDNPAQQLGDRQVTKLLTDKYGNPENKTMTSERHEVPSELVNERLQTKFGNAQPNSNRAQNTNQPGVPSVTNMFPKTFSHFIWAASSSKFRNVYPDTSHSSSNNRSEVDTDCEKVPHYDPELLNERLMRHNNSLTPKNKEVGIQKLTNQEDVPVSELLNKLLLSKYGRYNSASSKGPDNKDILEDKGSLQKNSVVGSTCLSDAGQDTQPMPEQVLLDKDLGKDPNGAVAYDSESVEERLKLKYGSTSKKKETLNEKQIDPIDASYYRFRAEVSLATDGPRPHIINHSLHSQPGNPTNCCECGNKLADYLKEMIIPDEAGTLLKNKTGKKRHNVAVFPGSRQVGKSGDTIFSNISSLHSKLPTAAFGQKYVGSVERRVLKWSDVLIVAKEMPKDCGFLAALRHKNIPVTVLMRGQTSDIETNNENKLFITSYKEVTGLERALIIFVPSESSNSLQKKSPNESDIPDLQLGLSLNHFTEEDRIALWYVASRSLASLVLILP